MVGQPAVERRLPRWILAQPGRHDVAHDALVDDPRVDAGAPHRLADYARAELLRGEGLERAKKLSGRRAHRRHDHRFTHDEPRSSRSRSRRAGSAAVAGSAATIA